jgi:hypothetical protein
MYWSGDYAETLAAVDTNKQVASTPKKKSGC